MDKRPRFFRRPTARGTELVMRLCGGLLNVTNTVALILVPTAMFVLGMLYGFYWLGR